MMFIRSRVLRWVLYAGAPIILLIGLVVRGNGMTILIQAWLHVRRGKLLSAESMKYEQHPKNPTARVLIVGDSTAFGTGASNPDQSLAGRLGHDFPEIDITNLAKNGARQRDIQAQLTQYDRRHQPHLDLIVMLFGANDVIHFSNLKVLPQDLPGLLAQAQALGSHVIFMTEGNIGNAPAFPRWFAKILEQRSREFQIMAQQKSKAQHVIFIDQFVEYDQDRWHRDPKKFYAADLFHPSGVAYGEWYDHLRQAMSSNNIQL